MYSTLGRPRQVTDAQVKQILEWHASRKTLVQFAAEMGLSRSLVSYVIQRGGHYKQISPERRTEAAALRAVRLQQLRANGWW